MIDPAQSFSNALGQGLGIAKSFRDEKRLDEDRAFNREQVLFDRTMKERQFELMVNQDKRAEAEEGRNKIKFDEDFAPENVAARRQLLKGQADGATAQARDAAITADNRQRMIDTDISVAKSNAASNRISAGAAAMNARTNAGELSLRTRMYEDERTQKTYLRAMQDAFPLLSQGVNSQTFSKIKDNPMAAGAVFQMAGAVTQSKAVMEALQDPNGAWLQDPKKNAQVFRFSQMTPIFNKAVKDFGFGPDAKMTGLRNHTSRGKDGKPRNNLEFTIVGTRNGRRETKTLYARPEDVFDQAAVLANVFGRIGGDAVSKARMAQVYGVADPEGFNSIISEEIKLLENKRKVLGRSMMSEGALQEIDAKLEKLYSGDALVAGELVFNRLGQIASR